MKVGDLSKSQLRRYLAGEGLPIETGFLSVRITSSLQQVIDGVHTLYADHEIQPQRAFSDCNIRVDHAKGIRRLFPRPTRVIVNGSEWYRGERGLQIAGLEWGLNWFIFRHCHHLLVIHAGALERNGVGLILPAHSGSGKSTFTAALACSGWRLFSDELALIRPETGELLPTARPICLKGDSLAVIREFAPQAQFGPIAYHRGESRYLGHLKPPQTAVEQMSETAHPGLILFPQFSAGSRTTLKPLAPSDSFIRIAQTSFNYFKLHLKGFETLRNLIENCPSYELTYSNLAEAVELTHQISADVSALVSHV